MPRTATPFALAIAVAAAALGACAPDELARAPLRIDLGDVFPEAASFSTGAGTPTDVPLSGSFDVDRQPDDCTGLEDGTVTFDTASVVFQGGYHGLRAGSSALGAPDAPTWTCDPRFEGVIDDVEVPDEARDGVFAVDAGGMTARYVGRNLIARHHVVADGPAVRLADRWRTRFHLEPATDVLDGAVAGEPNMDVLAVGVDDGDLFVDVAPGVPNGGAVITVAFHVDEVACDGFASCAVSVTHTEWVVADSGL